MSANDGAPLSDVLLAEHDAIETALAELELAVEHGRLGQVLRIARDLRDATRRLHRQEETVLMPRLARRLGLQAVAVAAAMRAHVAARARLDDLERALRSHRAPAIAAAADEAARALRDAIFGEASFLVPLVDAFGADEQAECLRCFAELGCDAPENGRPPPTTLDDAA